MMKIIHITYGFELGGIETMLVNIVNEQVKLNHRVYIIVINDLVNKSLVAALNENVKFICLKRKLHSKSPFPLLKMNYDLFLLKPDIIHLHQSTIVKYLLLPNKKKKVCVTLHDICQEEDVNPLKRMYNIYSISNSVKNDLKERFNINSDIVLNGIKPDLIKYTGVKSSSCFKILQISRLQHEKKGQHILIHAIHILRKKGFSNVYVDFIGDGESLGYLQGIVKGLSLEEKIHFLGSKKQTYIFEHLCDYNLFVQPSIYEGFGLTVVEAMAAKIPVLVSENQGPLEIIDNGKYGYSFENGNSKDCADKIELFLTGKNEEEQIESAYNRVWDKYNVHNTAIKYLEKYQILIGEND